MALRDGVPVGVERLSSTVWSMSAQGRGRLVSVLADFVDDAEVVDALFRAAEEEPSAWHD